MIWEIFNLSLEGASLRDSPKKRLRRRLLTYKTSFNLDKGRAGTDCQSVIVTKYWYRGAWRECPWLMNKTLMDSLISVLEKDY